MTEDRRAAIIWLLTHRNDHLPGGIKLASAERGSEPGFVHTTLAPAVCPVCDGLDSVKCPGCGGRGEIEIRRERDPYAKGDVVSVDLPRHEATHARDRQIERMKQQTREPQSEATLLAEANRRGYAWEEERRRMYERYDFAILDRALDALRAGQPDAAHALNAVYVDGWLTGIGQITPLVEQHCERGIRFLDAVLPHRIRTALSIHPAEARAIARMTSDNAATMTAPAPAEAVPGISTGTLAAAYPEEDAA